VGTVELGDDDNSGANVSMWCCLSQGLATRAPFDGGCWCFFPVERACLVFDVGFVGLLVRLVRFRLI
jgi:hypothetical protein